MNNKVKKEIKKFIKIFNLNCSVEEFKDKVDWYDFYYFAIFTEDCIEELRAKGAWEEDMLQKPYLSEDFIREFQDYVDWSKIYCYQELSEQFIWDFQDKLNIDSLIKNNKITKERLLELREINYINSRFDILDIR